MKIWELENRSIHLISRNCQPELQLMADELARESGYDCYFNPQNPRDPRIFLALLLAKPAGYLLTDVGCHDVTLPLENMEEFDAYPRGTPEELRYVSCIWVKPAHQQKGIGKQLCLTACSHFMTTPQEIGWSKPVSKPGQALLRSLDVSKVKLSGPCSDFIC
jgi:hypothetical protein